MVRQAPVVVEPAEVCAADIADLQFLVARRPRGVGQVLELPLAIEFRLGGLADLVKLVDGLEYLTLLAQDLGLDGAALDGLVEFVDAFELRGCKLVRPTETNTREKQTYQVTRLSDFVRCFLQSPLRRVYPPIAVVDVLLEIAHVVVLEAIVLAFPFRHGIVLGLEGLGVNLGTGPNVLLGIREEVVRACACDEGPTHLRIGDGQLCGTRGRGASHELLQELPLFGGHGCKLGMLSRRE